MPSKRLEFGMPEGSEPDPHLIAEDMKRVLIIQVAETRDRFSTVVPEDQENLLRQAAGRLGYTFLSEQSL